MRIGIDVRAIGNEKRSGADLYVQQLAEFVPKQDSANTYYLFLDKRATTKQCQGLKRSNVKVVRIPFANDQQYVKIVGFLAKRYKLDLIHFPIGAVPKRIQVPYIVSVLDLTFERYPEFYDPEDLVKQKATRLIAEKAQGVIAISQATKDDLVKFYGIPANHVAVTHLAPKDTRIKATPKKRSTEARPFLLFVGNVQPRKNLVRAVQALALIKKQDRPSLYIVGSAQDSKEHSKLQRVIKTKKLEEDVVIKGYLSEAELVDLYQNCIAICYPSLYEGFGYNILEAFAYNKPIILSNTSSMPEIAGKAGIYVDPLSVQDIARGIQEVLQPNAQIQKKISIGTSRLKKFTPQLMAKATARAYQEFSEDAI